ncbi:MAG: hypothetical protein SNJ83_14525, partial [Aggregatilineales bacterium]
GRSPTPNTSSPPSTPAASPSPQPAPAVHNPPQSSSSLQLMPNAVALAAYLGWLSAGVLEDVFMIDSEYAAQLLEQLKRDGILEDSPYPTPRFLRR